MGIIRKILHKICGIRISETDKTRTSWAKEKTREERTRRSDKETYRKTGNKSSS